MQQANRQSFSENVDTFTSQKQMSRPLSAGRDIPSVHQQPVPIATVEKTRRVMEREPPVDLLLSLTSLFFRHIHPWIPFLDILRVFADMGSSKSLSLLYYAMFGVSLPYSYDSRLDQFSSDCFWTYSKRRIFIDVLEEPSYNSLEALTILTLDLSGMTNGPQVWGALAVATKLAIQLKSGDGHIFRTSAAEGEGTTPNNADQMYRRRLFWAIYALDTYITMTTGNASDLTDYYIRDFLPTRYSTWRESESLSPNTPEGRSGRTRGEKHDFSAATPTLVFGYQLELMDISRRLHNVHIQQSVLAIETRSFNLAQDFFGCSTELFDWFQNMPLYLILNNHEGKGIDISRAPASLLMLHAYYHALVIHLHGLAAYPPDEASFSQLSQNSNNSRQICRHSVESLLDLVSALNNDIYDKLGWPFAWSVWIAMRYILVRNCRERLHEMETFYTLLRCLECLGKYWQIGAKYWRLLKQTAGEFEAQQAPEGPALPQKTLLSITDLRIPTSDLEDQFRPDPMLHTANSARDNSIGLDEGISDPNIMQGMDSFNDFLPNDAFLVHGLESDNWFNMPLFASSGYQH